MATAVKVFDELIAKARIRSKIFKRSIAGQIEYWAKMGELAEEKRRPVAAFCQTEKKSSPSAKLCNLMRPFEQSLKDTKK